MQQSRYDNVVASDLFFVNPNTGKAELRLHPGQVRAWDSEKRFVTVLAGSQSGKTSWGSWWLWREIQRKGPGDYLAVTSTFPLLKLKMLPEFLRVFKTTLNLGRWYAADKIFELANPKTGKMAEKSTDPMWGRVIFGSAKNADSLESATAKAAWLDEVGQDQFRIDSWEAVLRRLSLARGRCLLTTTLYNLGWLRRELYLPTINGMRDDVDIIQFKSIDNPTFPLEEYERARRDLPLWKFKMFYEGEYARPAGMIYDAFDENLCVIDPFDIPSQWPIHVGIDFGGVHTAAIFTAENPDNGALYHFAEYLEGGKSIKQHAEAFRKIAGDRPLFWVGGAAPEDQWRAEFREHGIPVIPPPVSEVEVGIARVYSYHKNNQIFVFRHLKKYLDEKQSYARKLNDLNEPTEEIENKNDFHMLDAERVLVSMLFSMRNRVDSKILPLLAASNKSRWDGGRLWSQAFSSQKEGRWSRGRKF